MLAFSKDHHNSRYALFNLKNLTKINNQFIISIFFILSIGVTFLYSASGMSFFPWTIKHIINLAVSSVVFIFFSCINIKIVSKTSHFLFIFSFVLLILTLFIGHTSKGATRWISLGSIKIQPSEIMKFSYIIFISRILSNFEKKRTTEKNILKTIFLTVMTGIPIVLQPDLTTSIIVFGIGFVMVFVNGLKYRKILIFFLLIILSAPILWSKLYDYQKKRITIFLNPELDPMGSGYNIIQSKIAIGSGGLFGYGIGNGSQSQLKYLPEKHTDFIFTMICEESGFIGAFIVIFLYFYIIYFNIKTSLITSNPFIINLSISLACFFFFHLIINTAMTSGMIPAAGIPLPMISYGGTVCVISASVLGLSSNCRINAGSRKT